MSKMMREMSQDELVEILRMGEPGVERWNALRAADPDFNPSLTNVDLSKLDLRGINLAHMYLSWVNFSTSDMREAVLNDSYVSDG